MLAVRESPKSTFIFQSIKKLYWVFWKKILQIITWKTKNINNNIREYFDYIYCNLATSYFTSRFSLIITGFMNQV